MFGRLRSIPRTFVGAIVLGLAGTYVLGYFPSEWTWTSNLRVSLPMIALFVVLIVLPQDRLRGAAVRNPRAVHRPDGAQGRRLGRRAAGVIVYMIDCSWVESAITTLTLGMSFAIIALSLTLLTGYAGEMNLAVVSFGAISTIVAYPLRHLGQRTRDPVDAVGLDHRHPGRAVIGGLVALPALRLRGLYLALATMAFGVFLSNMVLREPPTRTVRRQVLAVHRWQPVDPAAEGRPARPEQPDGVSS